MKAYLSSRLFSNFVSILFPLVKRNMHSCPVKSALLPLQLLEYDVMHCPVIRPKLCTRKMSFKSPSMWKVLCCEFRKEGCVRKNCPSKLCAGLNGARKCVCPGIIMDDQHLYIFLIRQSQHKIIVQNCSGWNALWSSLARRSQEKKFIILQIVAILFLLTARSEILASFESLAVQFYIMRLQLQFKIGDTSFVPLDSLWQKTIICSTISM